MTVYRDDLTGTLRPVIGAQGIPARDTVLIDPEPTLNRPTWWRVVLSTGQSQTTATPVTVAATLPVLSSPRTRAHVVLDSIQDWPELVYPQRVTVVDVVGRRQRAILADVEGSPSSKPILVTASGPDLDVFRRLCAPGVPLLLRGSVPGVEPAWIQVTGRTERRITLRADDWRRRHLLDVQHLEDTPDAGVPVVGDTLGDLAAAVPTTLGAIAARWSTLGQIATADLRSL